jgi:polyhydroxyalkanoate synthesis repressor PhaR
MGYVIKRYSNRKLYDTQESRYVTLEELEELIRAGKEISVVDASSGEDLTSVTLSQIILENERSRRGSLPTGFLHQLIKHGEAWQEFVQHAAGRARPSVSARWTGCAATGRRGRAGARPRRRRTRPATVRCRRARRPGRARSSGKK